MTNRMLSVDDFPTTKQCLQFILLLATGTAFGFIAALLGLPLPFMLGGLTGSALLVGIANRRGKTLYFPRPLRLIFIALIGTMIGSTVTPIILTLLPFMVPTIIALTVYVGFAHTLGFILCRRIANYDRVTAFYASMPGGFIEAVVLGERGGGDVQILTLSHFLRLSSVVVLVPALFYLATGSVVGSASGQSFETSPWVWRDVMMLFSIALIGLLIGKLIHLPAGHLIGPMILSALLYGSGAIIGSSPTWLLLLAQLVVGVGLGTHLTGASFTLLRQVFIASASMIILYLFLSACFAYVFWKSGTFALDILFLSFAPGGVTEMGLIALSLALSPVVVSAHHVYRIFLTVFIAAMSTRWFRKVRAAQEL